mmetsp:Transcript_38769/g.122206  ORF Transcript_38769/g.122206 Transcript_38769/m.122206 type:complete len:89 (+) Transcript_38769:298-564(+)
MGNEGQQGRESRLLERLWAWKEEAAAGRKGQSSNSCTNVFQCAMKSEDYFFQFFMTDLNIKTQSSNAEPPGGLNYKLSASLSCQHFNP